MKSAPAIAFECAPSRRVEQALLAVMVLALVASMLSAAPWPGIVCGLVVIGVVFAISRHRAVGRWRVAWRDDGTWGVADARSNASEATLAHWSRIGHCVVLRLRLAGSRRLTLWLLPDNVDADTRRRLVVRLARPVRDVAAQAHGDVSLLP
ncbi:MAG TPA: protein YgfX [Tahibacter sp.]|nr:protein YgfX [Tahibacter sp.]